MNETQQTLQQRLWKALQDRDNTRITAILSEDQGELHEVDKRQAYERLIRNQGYISLQELIDADKISLDIYEYDRFDTSIFELLLKAKETPELLDFLDQLLPQVDDINEELSGLSFLAYALENQASIAFLEKLIAHGASLDFKDNSDRNLLFYVRKSRGGFGGPVESPGQKLQFLLDQGVEVNQQDKGGKTKIFDTIAIRDLEGTKVLLEHGAELNIQNTRGETPYHEVLFAAQDPELYTLMRAYEPPRLDLVNKNGQSLLFDFVARSPLNNAATRELLHLLIEDGADLYKEEKDLYGRARTPAMEVAIKPDAGPDGIEILIGAPEFSVNRVDNQGNTLLHYVCSINLLHETSREKDFYRKVKRLLKAGADPHIRNDADQTPIDLAMDDNLKVKGLELMLQYKN